MYFSDAKMYNTEGFLFFSMIYWMTFMITVGFAAYVDKCKYCSLVVETFKAVRFIMAGIISSR